MRGLDQDLLLVLHKRVTGLRFSAVDPHKLAAAVARPSTGFGDHEEFPTLFDKAACLLHSIATTHPFLEDGNKRTAWVAALTVLELNGYRLFAGYDEAEDLVLAVVAHKIGVPGISQWLDRHSVPMGDH